MPQTRVVVSSFLASLLAMTLLAGCGKRGPLYLPGDKDAEQPEQQEESSQQNPPPAAPGY